MTATPFATLLGAAALVTAGQAAAHDTLLTEPVAETTVPTAAALAASLAGAADAAAPAPAGTVSLQSTAMATDTTSGSSEEGWEVSVMPYLWMAGMEGTIGIPRGTGEVTIDQSFGDILSNLDFALMGTIDARKGRFVILGDALYLAVGTDIETSIDPRFESGRVDIDTFIATAAAGYRVIDQDNVHVDLFAGARLLSLDTELALSGSAAVRTASASGTSVSPLIGARMRAALTPELSLGLYGDAGAFIEGADAKWQIMGDVRYQLSRSWTLQGGYRFMSINHQTERLDFDVDMCGPMLGVAYRF